MTEIEMEVAGGLCSLKFVTGVSTGKPGSDTSPGVGFELSSDYPGHERNGKWFHGMGVIGRADAARLRDELEIFLKSLDRMRRLGILNENR